MENLTVIVIYCGISSEKEVSERTGTAVINALRKKNINVIPFKLTRENIKELAELKYDIAFIALHGKYGEDGTVQGLLELLGKKYCGSGVLSSALCINKYFTKMILLQNGIRTPKFEIYNSIAKVDLEKINVPIVIKPINEGSSIGLSVVKDRKLLKSAVETAFKYDNTVMFEEYISGREVTIAVIENSGKIQTLPIIEIKSKHDFFDYESKYTKGGYDYVIPAELAKELEEEIKELSIKSFRALNCKDFARLDVMIDSKTNKPYIIEINTIPGMTETSLLPKAAAAAGIAFEDLIYNFIKNNL